MQNNENEKLNLLLNFYSKTENKRLISGLECSTVPMLIIHTSFFIIC